MSPWIAWRIPLAIAIMLVTFALLDLSSRPPAPLPASAPAAQFSSGRAMQVLERLIGESSGHPVSTTRNAEVRQRVIDEMTALGLSVETQATFSCQPTWAVCAEVTNLLARLPGDAEGPAVLLTAHYDSVAASPGAGDDMAGVAVLLEVARVLQAEPPLASPVILLVSDGEEIGLLGAQAFVSEHPWAQDVGVVVNLEANGTSGPSILFETTSQSGWLVETLAGEVPGLVGNAFADSLYTLFPFNTDLTVYAAAGIPGVNFAFIEHHARYHTPLDAPPYLDPGSVQHHGNNALAATRAFAAQDLRDVTPGERIYADLAPGLFVSWPQDWTLGFALLLAFGWGAATALAVRQRRVSLRQVLWGLLVMPLAVLLATATGLVLGLLAQVSSGQPVPWYANPGPLRVVLWGAALLIVGSSAGLVWRKAGVAGLFYGAWVIWAVLTVAVSALWPPASFMLLAPLGIALVLALVLGLGPLRADTRALLVANGVGLAGAGWMWLWFARGSDFSAVSPEFSATAAFAIALTAATGAGLLALPGSSRRIVGILGGGLVLLGLAAVVIGAAVPVYSETSPQPINIVRIEDTLGGEVRWALEGDGQMPESLLAARPFGPQQVAALPWAPRLVPVAPAGEGLPVTGAARDIPRADGEPVRLVLPTAPDGSQVTVYVPEEARVIALSLTRGDETLEMAVPPVEDGYYRFLCVAPACNDAQIEIALAGEASFTGFVVQVEMGLPAEDETLLAARPATAAPRHRGDVTMRVERIVVQGEE